MSLSLALNPNSDATNVSEGDRPFKGADKHAAVRQRQSRRPSYFLEDFELALLSMVTNLYTDDDQSTILLRYAAPKLPVGSNFEETHYRHKQHN